MTAADPTLDVDVALRDHVACSSPSCADHPDGSHCLECDGLTPWPCMPYRLAAECKRRDWWAAFWKRACSRWAGHGKTQRERAEAAEAGVADAWDAGYQQAIDDIDWFRPWRTRRITDNPHRKART